MNERHAKILELINEHKKVEVTTLSNLLGVSQVTIRKDLIKLEENGMIIREHGFATINDSDDIKIRLSNNYEIKQKIANRAAESVSNGETIMIESGSSCALLALQIAKTKKDITLITNSAFIADYVRKVNNIKIILLGGEYQIESQVMVRPITRKCAETLFVDKLFIGTDGFSKESGFTGNDYMRAETVSDMAKQANNVIVVTDSIKFSQKGVVSLIDTNKISAVFTDSKIPNHIEKFLIDNNINVVTI